jgi:hypothetical protein
VGNIYYIQIIMYTAHMHALLFIIIIGQQLSMLFSQVLHSGPGGKWNNAEM